MRISDWSSDVCSSDLRDRGSFAARSVRCIMDNDHRHRLLILACSATKRSRPGWIPAVDRYDGPLWQTLRAIGPDRQDPKVAVLSTRYGFIDPRITETGGVRE